MGPLIRSAFGVVLAVATAAALAGCSADDGAPIAATSPPSGPSVSASSADVASSMATPPPRRAWLEPLVASGTSGGTVELMRTDPRRGSATIATFSTPASTLYVTYQCLGPGQLAFGSLFAIEPCDALPATVKLLGQAGRHPSITVKVEPGTRWRILVERPG